jgi:hypothetical protein
MRVTRATTASRAFSLGRAPKRRLLRKLRGKGRTNTAAKIELSLPTARDEPPMPSEDHVWGGDQWRPDAAPAGLSDALVPGAAAGHQSEPPHTGLRCSASLATGDACACCKSKNLRRTCARHGACSSAFLWPSKEQGRNVDLSTRHTRSRRWYLPLARLALV